MLTPRPLARYPVDMDEQDFLNEIAANPAADAPRLVFADWLEERGDLRAELLRLLNDLIHIDVPDRAAKEARMRALLYEKNVPPLMPTFTNSLGMKFVQIPPGEFMMGAPDDEAEARHDEKPQHSVTISKPFWLGVHPVTQAEYQTVMNETPSWFSQRDVDVDGGDVAGIDTSRFPVELVTWKDATEFSRRLTKKSNGWNYRLPTEAEWEFACRAGTTTAFHCGESLTSAQANFDAKRPTKVGSFQPNAFGLHDLHGNVWEWCSVWFGGGSDDAQVNPTDLSDGRDYPADSAGTRVHRGGSWSIHAGDCRSAGRREIRPAYQGVNLGFRVAAVQPN
ncbi:MAG: SUMF1/EgtB/PvdO family nonheme iron enzyme [Planctomycetales bacterium]